MGGQRGSWQRQGEEQGRWERFPHSRRSSACDGKSHRLPAGPETEAVVSALGTGLRHEADLGDLGIHWPALTQTFSAKHCVLLSRMETRKRRRRTRTSSSGAACCTPGPRLGHATTKVGASLGSETLSGIVCGGLAAVKVLRRSPRGSAICFSGGTRASCCGSTTMQSQPGDMDACVPHTAKS